MTRFGKRSMIWLIVGSVMTGAGAVTMVVAQDKMRLIKQALQQVERSENDLAALIQRFEAWKANTPHGKAVSRGTLRIEPVALEVNFPPDNYNKLGTILGKMYTDEGILNLKRFTLEVNDGAAATMHISLSGQKTFLQE